MGSRHRSAPRRRRLRRAGLALCAAAAAIALAGSAAGHTGGLRSAAPESLAIPTWLFLATGGGTVGVSFILASFVTDRTFVREVHGWGGRLPEPGHLARRAGRLASVGLLALVLYSGVAGPAEPFRNLAILVVWVGWWAGYVASAYLVGNTWPALNPFRALAAPLPSLDLDYPERWSAWPSVAGLLALIWLEVMTPLADDPRLLAAVVAGYAAVTLAGCVAVGADRWFESVDPVARVFRYYGRVAPVERTSEGLRFRLPGAALADTRLVTGLDEVAFVVGVLFVTTYDGFLGTALWADVARAAVEGLGVPPLALYLAVFLGGYALFLGTYWIAARAARDAAETFLTVETLACRFAPSLLAIAAGYHLAHYLGLFLTVSPALAAVLASPFAPPQNPPLLAGLPGWFAGLQVAFVLVGHLLAVWVAHATAYDLFPGRLQAIRSQYGVTAAMVFFTMTSLWIVTQSGGSPPYV